MLDQRLAGSGGFAGDDIHNTGRQADLLYDLSKLQGAQRGIASWLEHNGIAHGQGRGDFPGQHEQWEVPGNNLTDYPDRLVTGQFALHELRPAGMIVEVARHQWNIDITCLADGFAVVH